MDLQDVTYSSPGPQSGDGSEAPLQTGSKSLGNASPLVDTGIVMERQRVITEWRPKQRYLCVLLSANCPFMPKLGFENCAKVKEDAVRHMNGYQCDNCGKRFGKKYGLLRHQKGDRERRCTKGKFTKVSPDLAASLVELESASGYANIQAVMIRCRPHCDWQQIREHQGQAKGDEGTQRTRKKETRLHLQRQAKQDLNAIESSGLSPVTSQSPADGSYINDDMTSSQPAEQGSPNNGGSELAFQQQRGTQVLVSGVHGQDSSGVGVMDRGHLGVGYGSYRDKTSSSTNNSSEPVVGYPSLGNSYPDIYNSPSEQAVGIQEGSSSLAIGPSVMNPPTISQGNFHWGQNYPCIQVFNSQMHIPRGIGTTTAAANYAQSCNFAQQDIAYGHGIGTINPNHAVGLTGQDRALDQLPGPHGYQQPVRASEIPVGHFRDLELAGETASLGLSIDPALALLGQPSGPVLDHGNGLHQGTENPIIVSDNKLQMERWLRREIGE